MGTLDVQTNIIIPGIKLEFYLRNNGYGTSQLFQVLDEQQLQHICKLAEGNLKMPVWKYIDKCCLKINDHKLLNTELIYQMKSPKEQLSYSVLQNICLTLWI